VDGNDVAAVAQAAERVVAGVRGGGPAILECLTTRVRGHFEGDAQKYRDPAEIGILAERDPVRVTAAQLEALGVAEAELTRAAETVEHLIAAAVEAARAGSDPDFEAARADVYTPVEAR